jgi:hypothetical protein
MFHTLPFLIPNLQRALIGWIRYRFMKGGLVFAVGVWLGKLGAG